MREMIVGSLLGLAFGLLIRLLNHNFDRDCPKCGEPR